MKELSLYILDIVQNSITAGAKNIDLSITEFENGMLRLKITDDGCGMDEDTLSRVKNPFHTSRTTRKVGLGIPYLTMAAEQTKGQVTIESRDQKLHPDNHGTEVTADFNSKHIDFPPMGDLIATIVLLIYTNSDIDFNFNHSLPIGIIKLDTKEMRQILEDIPLDTPEVIQWIKDYLTDQYQTLNQTERNYL